MQMGAHHGRKLPKWLWALLFSAISIAACTFLTRDTQGLVYGIGSYGTCQFSSCSISLSTGSAVAIGITPVGSASTCAIKGDVVAVTTGSSTGFTLMISNADSTNALVNGTHRITAVSGTPASPAALSVNTWGYRVDGIAEFGNGPTSASSNTSTPPQSFAAVPLFGSQDVVRTSPSASLVALETTIWYGVCSDTSVPSGSYSDTVIYTALVN